MIKYMIRHISMLLLLNVYCIFHITQCVERVFTGTLGRPGPAPAARPGPTPQRGSALTESDCISCGDFTTTPGGVGGTGQADCRTYIPLSDIIKFGVPW